MDDRPLHISTVESLVLFESKALRPLGVYDKISRQTESIFLIGTI